VFLIFSFNKTDNITSRIILDKRNNFKTFFFSLKNLFEEFKKKKKKKTTTTTIKYEGQFLLPIEN
jgi:hypothetical protein